MKKDFEREEEIWSEYFRIKNRLMDYDENLRECIGNARMLLRINSRSSRVLIHFAKAQKHVALVLDLALASGAIPPDADKEKLSFITKVAKGEWKGIDDFEKCQEYFRDWYISTKFYTVTKEKPRMLAPHEL